MYKTNHQTIKAKNEGFNSAKGSASGRAGFPHCCNLLVMLILFVLTGEMLYEMNDPTLAFWNC